MKIMIINTGGTISCVGNPLAPMTSSAFAEACRVQLEPLLAQRFPDLVLDYATDLAFPESANGMLDSTNLQPSDWCLIADYILNHYDEADGWVVLHGTDTMDFTGMALPLLLSRFSADGTPLAALSKPVILTGSQVPLFYSPGGGRIEGMHFNTDAFQNVCGAVAAARSGLSEVCLFFDSLLLRGSRITKTDANQFRGFSTPNAAPLGRYGISFTLDSGEILPPPVSRQISLDDENVRADVLRQLSHIRSRIGAVRVAQLNAFPAHYDQREGSALLADLINACVAQGVSGLVLESYGAGNFPSGNANSAKDGAIYKALDAASKAGVVIMDNTQVLHGWVDYNAYAAGAWLPAIGALNPVDMTPMASLAKLTVLLAAREGNGWSMDDVKHLMQIPLAGEMAAISQLDSRINPVLLAGQAIKTFNGSAELFNDPQKGPLLRQNGGRILWSMLAPDAQAELPGRLVVQNDGNLVFYSRNNQPLWASNTGQAEGAASSLRLTASAGDVKLSLYDFALQRESWAHRALI
ncbi:asparaginase domain-containing protein [Allorhizobium undicola]|uniref:asparaginase domain-containing protein n=1 Tax=Allorhizobium undicola TaxID=78527 RepID=UPI003D32C119